MNSETDCLNDYCSLCEPAKRARFMESNFPELAKSRFEEINRIYFIVDNNTTIDDLFMCQNCECFQDCKCEMENIANAEKPKKKIKQKFRPQRATPKGDGHRWKAEEKTITTWGSPADKARKRAAMDIKKQRKWPDTFVPEEEINYDTSTKIRKHRGPIRDRPCKPGFVEYTGKGWPKC